MLGCFDLEDLPRDIGYVAPEATSADIELPTQRVKDIDCDQRTESDQKTHHSSSPLGSNFVTGTL